MKQITHYGFTFYFDPSLKFCMVAFYSEFISLAVNKSNSKGIFCRPNQKQSETSKILIITLKVVYIRKLRACLANKIWSLNFCHSISITHHSSFITYHSIFHIRLPSSLNFHHLLFFTLFGGPTLSQCSFFFFFFYF